MIFTLKTREIFTKIVLVNLVLLILNNCLFIHTHLAEDGKIVVHSHPLKDKDHNSNSDNELEHFALLFESSFPITEVLALDENLFYSIIAFRQELLPNNNTLQAISRQAPRAPPIFQLI